MIMNGKQSKPTSGLSAVDQLFEDSPQHVRDALALHKSEKRRQDRKAFMDRQSQTSEPEGIKT
jgi:hypothetical protein